MTEESALTLKPLLPLSTEETTRLENCERVIERGLKTFVEVGQALCEIRDSRLYRCSYPTFESYCRDRWKIGRAHAYRLIGAVRVVENLSSNGDTVLPANEAQARELLPYQPEAQRAFWQLAVGTAPEGKLTAGHMQSLSIQLAELAFQGGFDDGTGEVKPIGQLLSAGVIEETFERLQRQRAHLGDLLADGDEWFTADSPFLRAARRVAGGQFDLDPASTPEANKIIHARRIYTKQENGLLHPWPGNVWLNPPFSFPLVQRFTEYAIAQYDAGISKSIFCLTNNSTASEWCQRLLKRFLVCFPKGRVPFWRVGRDGVGGSRDDQVIAYMGQQEDRFIKEFAPLGTIMKAV